MHTPFVAELYIYIYTIFDVLKHMGRGTFVMGQPRIHSKGAESSAIQLLKFPSINMYTFCCRTTKFGVLTDVGEGVYLWV